MINMTDRCKRLKQKLTSNENIENIHGFISTDANLQDSLIDHLFYDGRAAYPHTLFFLISKAHDKKTKSILFHMGDEFYDTTLYRVEILIGTMENDQRFPRSMKMLHFEFVTKILAIESTCDDIEFFAKNILSLLNSYSRNHLLCNCEKSVDHIETNAVKMDFINYDVLVRDCKNVGLKFSKVFTLELNDNNEVLFKGPMMTYETDRYYFELPIFKEDLNTLPEEVILYVGRVVNSKISELNTELTTLNNIKSKFNDSNRLLMEIE